MDRLGEGIESRPDSRAGAVEPRRTFRPDIQGLRAVAVTAVVLYHCGVTLVPGGYVGVDVFLVISGFLITSHLMGELERERRISLPSFYARRMRRLLPPALIVIVTTVVLARLVGPVLQTGRTTTDGFFTLVYAMNYRLAGQGIDYQLANAAPSPLQHFWSLAVEEQFYIVWPLGLILVARVWRRIGRTALPALVLTAITGIVVVSFVVSLHLTLTNGPLAYYSLQSRAWELGAGAALAAVLPLLRRLPRSVAAPLSWVGGAAVVAAALTFDDKTPFPGTAALLPVLGAAAVIAGGSSGPSWGIVRVLRGRLVQLVGNVSYGWYLWHWPALILAPGIYGHALNLSEKLEVCLLALWLAILTHLLLERPAARSRVPVRRWLPVGLSMSLTAALGLGLLYEVQPDIQGKGGVVASLRLDAAGLQALHQEFRRQAHDLVPSNLRPTLERASANIPPTSVSGCHVPLLKTTEPHHCVFGDRTASRTMLLFGDSHAEQWFAAVNQIAIRKHYRLVSWSKVACPLAAVTLPDQQLGRTYHECTTWRAERLAAIKKLKPDVIIASQADSLAPSTFDDSLWASRTAQTLRTLAVDTKHLIYIGDTPRAASDPALCLARPGVRLGSCAVPSDSGWGPGTKYHHLTSRHRSLAREVATVDLTRIDPMPWFCVEKSCPAVVGNTLVYRDDAHMTQRYSRSLAPLLQPVLMKAIRAS